MVLHETSFQDGTFVAHNHQVVDATRLQDASGTYGNVMTDMDFGRKAGFQFGPFRKRVQYRSFSDAAAKSNGDGMRVCPYHSFVPHTGLVPVRNVTNDRSCRGDKRIVCLKRLDALECHFGAMTGENLKNGPSSR